MKFLIAYDIACPKRLRQVASALEHHAQRVQKSVFLFDGTATELEGVHRFLIGLIDVHEDRIQSWPILDQRRLRRWDLGTVLPGTARCIVVTPSELLFIEDNLPQDASEPNGSAGVEPAPALRHASPSGGESS